MKYLYFLPASLLVLAGCSSHSEEAAPKPVVDVKVAKAETADVKITVHAPAALFAKEQANIGARIVAPIRKLLARKGDNVSAGQVIAQLENHDLLAQRAEMAAAVEDAKANLERVSAGTLPSDIERARGQAVAADAALALAQKSYDRRKQLFEQGAIPRRDLELSQTELTQAKANSEVSKKTLDLLRNQSREQDIIMAKSKLEQAKARLAQIEAQIQFTEIRSPFNGSITEQFMFPGDMAKPDAPMFTVMDLSVAVARAQVPEGESAGVHTGLGCSFVSTDKEGVSYEGRVSVVNQSVDPARRTLEAWCEIPNGKRVLRAGMFGQVAIVTGNAPKSVVAPIAAVQFVEGSKKGVVMVASSKGTALKKEVETGEVFDGKVQVKSGLDAGESVIVQGGYGLPDGVQIRVQEDKKQ